MSSVQRAREVYDAMARGDVAAVLAAFEPNIEWCPAEGHPFQPDGKPWIGRDAVTQNLFVRGATEWDGFTMTPTAFHPAGDTVVVEGRYGGTVKASGRSVNAQFCHILERAWRQDAEIPAVHGHRPDRGGVSALSAGRSDRTGDPFDSPVGGECTMRCVGEGLLPIGMFSRASSLSIKTLRAYHEAGIIVPARVDPHTGYRAYTVDQLADASIVQRLRALDLPLEKVREVLHGRDPELTRRVLAGHQVTMRARLAETERIVAELQSGLAPVTHTPVHVRFEPAGDTVRIVGQVTEAELGAWLGWAFDRLSAVLEHVGVVPDGPRAALYSAEIHDDGPEHAEAFIPVGGAFVVPEREREVSIGEVPAAWVAVLVHAGDYESIGDTYRTLGAWVARNADHAGERVREWYVVGASDVEAPSSYRTEIAWPIEPPGGEGR